MRKKLLAAVFLLLTACRQGGESLSLEALSAVARSGDQAAIEKLVGLLGTEGELANDRIYALLISLSPQLVVPALLNEVGGSDPVRREYVIAALGNHKAIAATGPIASVLADQRLGRRYVAAWALGEIGGQGCVNPLLRALSDPQAEVRKTSTRALIKQQRITLEPLLRFLPAADPLAAAGAIRALGDMADPRAFDVLAEQVRGENRAEVILALGKIKSPRAEGLVLEALHDPRWQVRMHAAMALGEVGSASVVPSLEGALEDEVNVVREWAARSLEKVTGRPCTYRNEAGEMVAPYTIYH